jgi:uncharacterized protein (DUF58 family)
MGAWKTIRKWLDPVLETPDWLPVPTTIRLLSDRSRTAMVLLWLYAYYVRILTIPGRMVVAVFLMIGFYTSILFHTPVIVLTLALFALMLVDFLTGFVFRPNVGIERRIPTRVRAGTRFLIRYRIANRRRVPVWNLLVDNLRGNRNFPIDGSPAHTDSLVAGEHFEAVVPVLGLPRGRHRLPTPMAESAYPFCIFKWTCRSREVQYVLAFPEFHTLRSFSLPVGKRFQRVGNALLSKVGESMDVHGCREFRVGDDPRHIHWPSTARIGEPVVKEFQDEFLSRIAIVLDTRIPTPDGWRGLLVRCGWTKSLKNDAFEASVSLVAALVDYLTRGDLVVDIFAAGSEVYHFQGGRKIASFDHILDILATLGPERDDPFDRLEPSIFDEVAEIGSAVVVLLGWDDVRSRFIDRLRSCGVAVRTLLIRGEGTGRTSLPRSDVEPLDASDVLAGKVDAL